MLYKGQLNELIRLAEIDASNPICLKKKLLTVYVMISLDELKLMLTEEFCSQQTILFLTEYHKVEVLKSNHA
jgi:hypothetical protein